jgi:predicted solute-binding protein
MELTLGFSPCPNDTFIFEKLLQEIIQPTLHLNL